MSCLHGLARDNDEQYFGGPEGHCDCGLAYERYIQLRQVIGKNLLSRCLDVEKNELGTYFEGNAALSKVGVLYERLGFLSLVVYYLRGTHDHHDIYRWFLRHRQTLGCSPAEFFRADWNPKEKKAQKILEIAREVQQKRTMTFFELIKRNAPTPKRRAGA